MNSCMVFGREIQFRDGRSQDSPVGWPPLRRHVKPDGSVRYEVAIPNRSGRFYVAVDLTAEDSVVNYLYLHGSSGSWALLTDLLAEREVCQIGQQSYWAVGRHRVPVWPQFGHTVREPLLRMDLPYGGDQTYYRFRGMVGRQLVSTTNHDLEEARSAYWVRYRRVLQTELTWAVGLLREDLDQVRQMGRELQQLDTDRQ